ncbi:hypothetical protein [Pedobacter frigoris]|uniref:Uncharacterized protein n=1 Tax=Pedobacter frigoris TaxID=2571272 RepID=A0A4U1CFQ0_9SPHI|nr:hypothetical protein [Pedobacter frigoris]TKC04443.1 hypothetical protein FA047_17845 [Pedobacter frigoris]
MTCFIGNFFYFKLWSSYDAKLERSLALNLRVMRELQTQKAEHKLRAFRKNQIIGVILGVLWIAFLVFLVANTLDNIYFVVSVGFIILFNVFATIAYIRHIVMLTEINIEDSVTMSQLKITEIQSSFTNIGRILVLQTPFYCTFWYNRDLVANAGIVFWLIQLVIVSFFTFGSIYLFIKLTYKNIHLKWVRSALESFGGKTLTKAIEFLKEIEEYKTEKP